MSIKSLNSPVGWPKTFFLELKRAAIRILLVLGAFGLLAGLSGCELYYHEDDHDGDHHGRYDRHDRHDRHDRDHDDHDKKHD